MGSFSSQAIVLKGATKREGALPWEILPKQLAEAKQDIPSSSSLTGPAAAHATRLSAPGSLLHWPTLGWRTGSCLPLKMPF